MSTIDQLLAEAYGNWNDAEVLARTGHELHDRNRLDHARAVLGRAIELAPDSDHQAWEYHAYSHLRAFEDEAGLSILREGIKVTGADSLRAVLCFNRAIGAKPSFAGARINLGKLYENQERFDLAEEAFREIPVANPDYAAGPMSLALFLARRERWEEAERICVETWPNLAVWYRNGFKNNPDAADLLSRDAVKQVVEDRVP